MRNFILIFLIPVMFAGVASGQTLDLTQESGAVPAEESSIRVIWSMAPGSWLEGRLVSRDFERLVMIVKSDTLQIPYREIEWLQVRTDGGSHAGTGALVGSFVVGSAALGLGLSMAGDSFFDASGGEVFGLTVVGILAGGLVGGIVGAIIPNATWEDDRSFQVGVIRAPDKSPGLTVSLDF